MNIPVSTVGKRKYIKIWKRVSRYLAERQTFLDERREAHLHQRYRRIGAGNVVDRQVVAPVRRHDVIEAVSLSAAVEKDGAGINTFELAAFHRKRPFVAILLFRYLAAVGTGGQDSAEPEDKHQ